MSGKLNDLYTRMPLFIQNLGVSAYGYYWRKRRYGGIFLNELSRFKERESYCKEDWEQYLTKELQKLLLHSYATVPYYRSLFQNAGINNPMALRNFEIRDLPLIPPLEKETLRTVGGSSLLSESRETRGQFFSSSGSTGTPVKIFYSHAMHQRYAAANEARSRHWAGVNKDHSRGMIGGRRVVPEGHSNGPYFRYNFFEKQVYLSAYHISSQTAPAYANALNEYGVDYMTGYAISNFLLARHFSNQDLRIHKMKAVITSSEKLTPEMRDMFYKVYGCKSYDGYSGVEGCGMITENEHGQLLVSPDVGIMEILNERGEPCQPGEVGEIYSTGLLNYDQPLIRYRIGDKVRLAQDQRTLCGRNMVVVDEIMGRDEDVVKGPDGREMVRFHGLYVDIPGLVAGQLIQHSIDKFTLNLQIDQGIFNRTESEKLMRHRLFSQLGEVQVRFEYPNRIPPGPNGKFKAVISEVTKTIS